MFEYLTKKVGEMIYLLIREEHSFDMTGKTKTHIEGYTTNKQEAEQFTQKNTEFSFGTYKYKKVKEHKANGK